MNDVNNTLFFIASSVLLAQFFVFYYKIGLKFILHPGTYFAVIWFFSVLSQQILMNLGLALIKDDYFIDELNIFVIFTSLLFSFWMIFYKYDSYELNKSFNFFIVIGLYKKVLILMLLGAILQMAYTWYSLGVTSLNLAHIRNLNTSDKSNYFGTKSDLTLSLLKYSQFFYPILSIVSGYFLGLKYLIKERMEISTIFLYIPLIVSLIYVFTNGGRNPIFIGVKLYFIGLCFTLPYILTSNNRTWLIKRIFILFLSLILFSTFVADSRSEFSNKDSFSKNFENPILSSSSGFIEYLGAHYYGYQLRNIDSFDGKNLGLGYFTFNGLFDVKLPFSSYLGLNQNLGNFFGYDENPIDYFYLWEDGKEGYYTTNSVYLGLKLDFGFIGTLLFLIFFTNYTHRLFLKTQNSSSIGIYTIYWFYLCFNFWASSNFRSSYATGIIGSFIMFFLFSFIFTKKVF